MTSATLSGLTADELAAMPDGDLYELADGKLVERAMSPLSGYVAGEIYAQLRDYCKTHPRAVALPAGVGFLIRPDDPGLLRKPDAAVVLRSRLPGGRVPDARFDFAPDLAVEVASPTDRLADIEAKIGEYLDAGGALVWLAKPSSRRVVAYRPDGSEVAFREGEEVPGEPVLPGFRLRVAEVFPPPEPTPAATG